MNALVQSAPTSNAMIPTTMDGAIRLAEMMAKGKLVPGHLQGHPADCLLVIEQAMRWNMSPFAVAQCTSVIQNKLMFEGKLVSAALHTSGLLETRLRERFTGEGASRAIILTGTIRGETEPRAIEVKLTDAKTSNGMWTKQPDQQLVYFATRAWARRHAPEVMLGVYSPEEFDEPKRDTFAGPTIDGHSDAPRATPAKEDRPRTNGEWLDRLEAELAIAGAAEQIDAILAREDVQTAQDRFRNGARDRLAHITAWAIERAQGMESSAPADAEAVE